MDSNGLHSVFPTTLELLHEKRISYLKEQFKRVLSEDLMIASSSDHSRWFPVFLKFQGIRPEILEVAEYEYLSHFVRIQDQGFKKKEAGRIELNSSIQFVELYFDQPKLKRSAGLYCFIKKQNEVLEFRLNIKQALIVDILHDERKYSKNQLIMMAKQHALGVHLSEQQWLSIVDEMVLQGILDIL